MKTAWIGLGNLGRAMAFRLKEKETRLIVWNRTKKTAIESGFPIAATPAEAADQADIIWLNLYDSEAVRQVLYGEEGILKTNLANKIIIDTTTNHFLQVLGFHQDVTRMGGVYLEAPVIGSVGPAQKGALTMMVSGDKNGFDSVKAELEKVASTIFYLETPSLATKMKLINNHVLGGLMSLLAEAIATAESAGLSKSDAIDILQTGAGNCALLSSKREKLLHEDFSAHFSSGLIYKDLHYLEDLAFYLKRPVFTAAIPRELYATLNQRGEDYLDFSAVYNLFKKA